MMKELLPLIYENSQETAQIQDAIEPAFLAALDAWDSQKTEDGKETNGLLQQLFVETSTWGLDLWESLYGIETDRMKPNSDRRSRLISKMRGKGTTTVRMLLNLAKSFVNGDIQIAEYPELHKFVVSFGEIGIPPRLDDLSAAIDEVKPAHLYYEYEMRFCTHKEINQAKYTHKSLKDAKLTHTMIRNLKLQGG